VVWAVNPHPKHKLDAAKRYGLIRAIFDEREGAAVNGSRPSPFATDRMLRRLWEVAEQASPDDYLLPCGNVILCMMAAGVWLEHFSRLRLLIFGANSLDYELRDIPVEQLVRTPTEEEDDGAETAFAKVAR
jgi:hypothetical protein